MATTEVETVNSGANKAKMGGALVLAIAGFVAFYMLKNQGIWAQWGALLLAFGAAIALFLTSDLGHQFIAFVRDAVKEAKKVVWPTRKEATQITLYVFAFVVVMAMFLWMTDKTLEWLIYGVLLGWKA